MATDESNATPPPEQPADDILGRLIGMTEIRLVVGTDPAIGAVELVVEGVPFPCSVLLSTPAALNLVMKVGAAVARLRGWGEGA